MKIMRRVVAFVAMLIACAGAFASPDTDLYNAVKTNRLGDVQSALSRGANPNQKIADINTSCFNYAVEKNNFQMVKTMLRDSVIPVAIDGSGDVFPALFIAIKNQEPEMLKILIENGANVNVVYRDQTPLMYATNLDLANMVSALDKYCQTCGVKLGLDWRDSEGNSALSYAIDNDTPRTIKALLLCKNIKYTQIDERGRNAFFEVCKNCSDAYDIISTCLYERTSYQRLAEFKDNYGNPLICVAIAEKWDSAIVDCIIENYVQSGGEIFKLKYRGSGIYKNKNIIGIMNANHTEEDYQDIFEQYM